MEKEARAVKKKKRQQGANAYGWACDFETNNDENDCRVWCWGAENIETGEYRRGKTIEEFINFLARVPEKNLYFHNLKFDGGFIIDWLLNAGFKYTEDTLHMSAGEFGALISNMNVFYTITTKLGGKLHQIIDSLKILPFPISAMPKMFGLPESKGEIEYDKPHPKGYEPTEEEWDYLYRDVHILAGGLKYIFTQGHRKITADSNAYTNSKEMIGKEWGILFPRLDEGLDHILRKGYKGGYTIVGPQGKNGDVGSGIVLDRNSMYPSEMANGLLPYGQPVHYNGEYKDDPNMPLYVARIRCSFDVKEGYLPTIQLKSTIGFNPVEYLTTTNGEIVELTLTNIDLELFKEHYEADIEYLDGWKFRAREGILRPFVEHWYTIKEQASIDKNDALRTLAKLMLNSAYGKFAKRGVAACKEPVLEDGIVRYRELEEENMRLEYLPMGMFITARARDNVIRLGQRLYDRLLYIDTDSLHLLGDEIPDFIEQHPTKLGAWDKELSFIRARYIRPKTYLEDTGENLIVKCAGLSSDCKTQVTWENFHEGAVYTGKLQHKTVRGGVVLKPIEFKIKVDKSFLK